MPNEAAHFNYTLDPEFKRFCTNSGLEKAILVDKKARFMDLANLLEQAIKEAERANSDHSFWRAMEAAARTTSIISKTLFMLLAAIGGGAAATGSATVLGGMVKASSAGAMLGTTTLNDTAGIIVKAINEELRAGDAAERYAKNKIDLAGQIAKNSASKTAKSVTGIVSTLWDAIDIVKTVYDHYDAYNAGGDLNIDTSGIKKQLKTLRQKIIQIDDEISSLKQCSSNTLA